MRLFVVDRLVLSRALDARSRHPSRARTLDCPKCGAALEALRAEPVDVIISDLDMPGMDGMEFMRRLSEIPASPWLIVSSAQQRPIVMSVEKMAAAYGVRVLGSIAKPPTPAKLAEVLARYPLEEPIVEAPGQPIAMSPEAVAAAIANGEIGCRFQPKVEIATRRIVGAEALMCRQQGSGGVILPARLLSQVERLGSLPALTDAIIAKACSACAAWRRAGSRATVSINISLSMLGTPEVADALIATIGLHGLQASDVVIEIAEPDATSELGPVLEALARLRMRGAGLAIDDFGTGYASMQQLTGIPFTELKIDPSFVRGATSPSPNRAALESSIELARRLNLKTVAQGVQTEAERRVLSELGCDMAQGSLFGEPMPGDDFLRLLKRSRT
jgi:EAL domain-containing protein (putative c-di-GMP-specific phosphodiesterase class I)